MDFEVILRKLHEDYNKDKTHGCLERAIIIYCFLKNNGLNPEIISFSFLSQGIEITHHVVIENNKIYDFNKSIFPIGYDEYKKEKENKHINIKWENSRNFILKNHLIKDSLIYLSGFDEEFQNEIMPLINKEYITLANNIFN